MELLVHINKRVKSRPKVLLPVADLITQFRDPNVSPFVTVCIAGRCNNLLAILWLFFYFLLTENSGVFITDNYFMLMWLHINALGVWCSAEFYRALY